MGAGSAIEKEQPIGGVAKQTLIGAGIGAVVSSLFEGIGALTRKISQSEYVQKRTGYTYNKELQPAKKDLAQDISKGFKTFGEDVANVVDDKGNPVYVGKYDTLLNKAKNEISTKGEELNNLLKSIPDKTATKNQVAGDIVNIMENIYGQLSPAQLKQIQFEINRMPNAMNLTELLKTKRMYDSLIPENFWSKLNDPATSFPSLVKYTLRDNARKLINQLANNPTIQKLNQELSIAMDVRKMVSNQLAQRATQKISGQSGFYYKLIGRLIDDYILNPAITTRVAQGLKNMGTKVGQTPIRQAVRFGTIKELEK